MYLSLFIKYKQTWLHLVKRKQEEVQTRTQEEQQIDIEKELPLQ